MNMTVPATLKSPFRSKTNITAFIMLLFSLFNSLGWLPASLDATTTVNTLVGFGSALVIFFRTRSTDVLTAPQPL